MQFECRHCGETRDRPTGEVNRARRRGLPLYCDKTCSGLARRKERTDAEKREAKRLYDMAYRAENLAMLKAKKAEHFRQTYDPAKARVERKKRAAIHAEYCRRPQYREWKRDYDRRYRAEKEYGEFAECFLLILDIRSECLSRMSDYEIRYSKGRVAMSQQRRRNDARTHSQEPQVGPLGHLEPYQGRKNGSLTG